jgi:hypothetical protein
MMTDKERLEEIKEWFNADGEMHEFQIEWLIEQAEKVERYERALTLALMTLENNNLMNDDYRKIHAIADGEL